MHLSDADFVVVSDLLSRHFLGRTKRANLLHLIWRQLVSALRVVSGDEIDKPSVMGVLAKAISLDSGQLPLKTHSDRAVELLKSATIGLAPAEILGKAAWPPL